MVNDPWNLRLERKRRRRHEIIDPVCTVLFHKGLLSILNKDPSNDGDNFILS